jgi:membrane fusion protein (multidrug efflux system)
MLKLPFPPLSSSGPCIVARRRWSRHAAMLPAALVTGLFAAACSKPAPQQAPPPPEVQVITIATRPVANVIELPGRLQAVRISEVRARVDGIVQRRLYTEGTDVQAGQPLFQIDPRQLQAQLSAAEASLRRAEATAANAAQDVNRYKGLVSQQALSQQEYDAAVARQRTAQADVAQVEAQIAAARLSLSYTTVTAPISGRAGRAEVTEGALVSAGAATLMTRIEQIDPIYANFSQSSADLLKLREQMRTGTLKLTTLRRVPVSLVLEDGTQYPHQGQLDFVDMSIDETTGTAALRAEFPNPQRTLLPGQFVRAQIDAGVRPNGVLIPQRAVTVTPQGANVLVVGAKDIVESRPVTVGALSGGSWQILSGLAPGERVIVEGLQKAVPGQPVRVAAAPAAPAAVPAAPDANADAP